MSTLSLRSKLLVTVLAVGSSAAVAGLGTFGAFSDTTTASTPVDTGIVNLDLGAVGAANRLTVAAVDIVPGDTIQRAFTLTNGDGTGPVGKGSTSPLGSVTLTTTASTTSVLDTDTTDGLQLKIEKCTAPWLETPVVGGTGYTYTCADVGGPVPVVASRPVIGSIVPVTSLSVLTAAPATDNLRATLTFPATAGNPFQDKASTIVFTFTGNQRTATGR